MANAATWRKRVEEWRASGLKAMEFAKDRGLSVHQLWNWAATFRRKEGTKVVEREPIGGKRWTVRPNHENAFAPNDFRRCGRYGRYNVALLPVQGTSPAMDWAYCAHFRGSPVQSSPASHVASSQSSPSLLDT
jgi:hypothetical protein